MDSTLLLWGLGLLAVALLLLVIDVFVPSFGVLSLTSLAVAIAGVVCLFRYDTAWGITGALLVVVGGPIMAIIGLQIMPNTPIGRKLVLQNPRPSAGTDDGEDRDGGDTAPASADANPLAGLMAREGEVLTDLRPVGTVLIEGRRYDALAEAGLVKRGTRVRVVGLVDGMQIRVRPVA
jgi:membrane-bound ClpP family serine protease